MDVVVIDGVEAIAIDKALDAVAFELSVTSTVKLKVPGAEGVPLITPVVANDNPAGSDPADIDQLNGSEPPDRASVVE